MFRLRQILILEYSYTCTSHYEIGDIIVLAWSNRVETYRPWNRSSLKTLRVVVSFARRSRQHQLPPLDSRPATSCLLPVVGASQLEDQRGCRSTSSYSYLNTRGPGTGTWYRNAHVAMYDEVEARLTSIMPKLILVLLLAPLSLYGYSFDLFFYIAFYVRYIITCMFSQQHNS